MVQKVQDAKRGGIEEGSSSEKMGLSPPLTFTEEIVYRRDSKKGVDRSNLAVFGANREEGGANNNIG